VISTRQELEQEYVRLRSQAARAYSMEDLTPENDADKWIWRRLGERLNSAALELLGHLLRSVAVLLVIGLSACGGLLVLPPDDAGAADVGRADAPTYGPVCPFDTLRESEMHDCGPLASPWRCDVYAGPVLPDGGCAWPGSPRFLVRGCNECPWPADAGKAVL
jgi:predicted small lipoprotein YifL